MSLFDELKSKSAMLQEGEVVAASKVSSEQPSFTGLEGDLNQLQKEKPLMKRNKPPKIIATAAAKRFA